MKRDHILVIRLGALGDLVLCFQAFYEIRRRHPDAEIALLTMPAFADFARSMPWFDKVIVDERAPGWRIDQWFSLRARVRAFAPIFVYDLQGKFRQSVLFGLLGGPVGPSWSGAAPLCSHPRLWPPKPGMHYTNFVSAQLRRAGVPPLPAPDLAWLNAPLEEFSLPERYVVLIPGCAPGRDYKRWSPQHYAELVKTLGSQGIVAVAAGTKTDAGVVAEIRKLAPSLVDLSARTNLLQLAALMRQSMGVIGNDTGPTHLAAAIGVPTLVLMSEQVNSVWAAPRGPFTAVVQGQPLKDLSLEKVLLALPHLLDRTKTA